MATVQTRAHPAAFDTQHAIRHLTWFAAVAAVAFAVPYVFTTAVDINHDLYYLIYFAIALTTVSAYVALNGVDVATMFRQNWQLSLALGALASAFVVWNVLAREDSTPRPDGAYFAFEFAWRGLAYGVVDAILLSAFPAMVAFSLLGSNIAGLGRRVAFAGIALVLTIIITATYHLGYEQFRDDGIGPPETGNTIITIPTLASGNPIGSIIAHAAMHGAAVTHAYETDVFLPPQTSAD